MLDLKLGRPLFALPLSPAHAIHKDINGDGQMEHIHAVVNPSEGRIDYTGGCGFN